MTTIIKPLFERKPEDLFESTKHRFFSLVKPIQSTATKNSDFGGYVLTPFVDSFLEPAFALDVCIHTLNALASLGRCLYLWTLEQQSKDGPELGRRPAAGEWDEFLMHLWHAFSAFAANTCNVILSTLCWFTRPVASLAQAAFGESETPPPPYSQDNVPHLYCQNHQSLT